MMAAETAAAVAKPSLISLKNILILAGIYVVYRLGSSFLPMFKREKKEGKKTTEAVTTSLKAYVTPEYTTPKDVGKMSPKSMGGIPMFYNEVDHTKGRFLGWMRYPEDYADERIVLNGFYRARINVDVRYLWLFPGAKEEVTPCRFRPGIDSVFKAPGEEQGIPPEGLMILKRSIDGRRLGPDSLNRYRNRLLDELHRNAMLSDTISAVRDKERLLAHGDMTREAQEDMMIKLKRNRKTQDAAMGKSDRQQGFGMPYGQEMYGNEEGAGVLPGADQTWKFEG
jgi:hypothetical protein